MAHYHPEDRPDPSEQPIRARVPDHVAAGAFSTGVIVMTAQSEFILDFVQNLGRPHQIIARVVMPHHVLPQLVDALHRNIDLYKNRWGELPQTGQPRPTTQDGNPPATSPMVNSPASKEATSPAAQPQSSSAPLGGGGAAGGGAGAGQSPPPRRIPSGTIWRRSTCPRLGRRPGRRLAASFGTRNLRRLENQR